MSVTVHIIDGPLGTPTPWDHPGGYGAFVVFEGIVRPTEDDRPITALDYEAYEPMASKQVRALGESILGEHGLIAMCVEHSRGRVPNGACSFRLRIVSAHRKESLAAMDAFIDRMKRDVPIWKSPVA